MKFDVRILLIFCAFAGVSACASPNVYHFEDILQEQDTTKTVDVYMDAYGMVYPETGIGFDYLPELEYSGELKLAATDPESLLCQTNTGGEVEEMCNGGEREWEDIQTGLWGKITDRIAKQFNDRSGNRAIVVLIHGFNVDSPERDYRIAQARINQVGDQNTDTVFVRVHWDGSKGPVKTKAWSKAQYTGPLVGFRMREFYNELSKEDFGGNRPSLHILSHSSGAFILSASFGNPISSLPRLAEPKGESDFYDNFKDHRNASTGKWAIPQMENLHVGLLAAASPSDSFTGYVKNLPTQTYDASKYTKAKTAGFYLDNRGWLTRNARLTIALNPKDFALSNAGIFSANTSILGAKGVGAKKETFCFIDDWASKSSNNVGVVAMDFQRTPADEARGLEKKLHDFSAYLTQDASTGFFERLLGLNESGQNVVGCN